MGYTMRQADSSFRIAETNKRAALQAIKALENNHVGHYAWVNEDSWFTKARTLEEALDAWGWHSATHDEGDIIGLSFSREKIRDERILFRTIAPYVHAGSYIEMLGEDGDRWRWVFNGQTVIEKHARVVWD